MTSEILVSISCITYNHARFLRRCFDGFLSQVTNFNYEILVHDDCSTDGTIEIIKEFSNKYPELIKPIFEDENQFSLGKPIGTSVWNLPRAKGKYIAICEGDDYWTDSYKLQKQVDFLERNKGYGLCYTDYSLRDEHLRLVQASCFRNGKHRSLSFEDHLVNQGYIAPMTWLFSKEVFSKFNPPKHFFDRSFAIALEFFHNSKIGYIEDDTAVHVIHKDSATHQKDPIKAFSYKVDVFKEQLFYSKSFFREDLATKICFNKYLELLPEAIAINNSAFINEANLFFSEKGADFNDIYKHAEMINSLKGDASQARNSHAYRIGSAIIRPIKKLFKR